MTKDGSAAAARHDLAMGGFSIGATDATTRVTIVGHGVEVGATHTLQDLTRLVPVHFPVRAESLAQRTHGPLQYGAVLAMGAIATMAIEVSGTGRDLLVRAWNSLWLFHLIGIAVEKPCLPLFSFTDDPNTKFTVVNPHLIVKKHNVVDEVKPADMEWVYSHIGKFDDLINNKRFATAIIAFSTAHYLPTVRLQLMLLWSGIESVLDVDAELRFRLALNGALLLGGDTAARASRFAEIKKSYAIRSRAVHGADIELTVADSAREFASSLLARLLRRCVELGRVPTSLDYDSAAVSGILL